MVWGDEVESLACWVEGLGFWVEALGFRLEPFKVLESCGRNGFSLRAAAAFYG